MADRYLWQFLWSSVKGNIPMLCGWSAGHDGPLTLTLTELAVILVFR
jgi:hypothetical protein